MRSHTQNRQGVKNYAESQAPGGPNPREMAWPFEEAGGPHRSVLSSSSSSVAHFKRVPPEASQDQEV